MNDRLHVDEGIIELPPRFIDAVTADLNRLSRTFEDFQSMRIRVTNRLGQHLFGPDGLTKEQKRMVDAHPEITPLFEIEKVYARELKKVLRSHVLWDWVQPLRGLAGARTGRIIAAIAHPHRWPGQQCSGYVDHKGRPGHHTFPPVLEVGSPCPEHDSCPESDDDDVPGQGEADGSIENDTDNGRICPGIVLPPRGTTGVKSVWHYFGLMPGPDGRRLVCRQKGVQANYSPRWRALVLGDTGTADQIVLQRTAPYRERYDARHSLELSRGCSKLHAHLRARIVAAKDFLGDLLMEWKRRAPKPGL